ncbi:MAG: DUF885 domain-containing protein [Pseudomonadota bacterium]
MRNWLMSRAGPIAAAAICCSTPSIAKPSDSMARLSSDIVAYQLRANPFLPLVADVKGGRNDGFIDVSPAAIARDQATVDALLVRLGAIDPDEIADKGDRLDYYLAREMLEADKGLRVCRNELWSVSHMSGWPSAFPELVERQPVASAKDRADALARWGAFPGFIASDIANLKRGLARGYSAPRSVAVRTLAQVEGLIAATPEESPFYAPAAATRNRAFKARFAALVRDRITPAIKTYRDFLKRYIPAARTSMSVLDLPNGRACYDAWLRNYTTLDRPGEAVAALGEKTVAANVADIRAIGQKLYGTDDYAAIMKRVKDDPSERFASKDEVVAFNREIEGRAEAATAGLVDVVPTQRLEVRAMTGGMEASGASSHYLPEPDPAKPALYSLQAGKLEDARRAVMAITAVHEGYPGHHLQFAYAARIEASPLSRLSGNSAYVEGWARYAERMADEIDLLATPQAKISRRAWPARGMVVDPGIHLGRWSREKAVAYLLSTGLRSETQAQEMVDRIAIIPGQLTAYDSGGLEIVALRDQARAALGARFALKQFNAIVLGDGVVPLALLRHNVEAWIAAGQGANPH